MPGPNLITVLPGLKRHADEISALLREKAGSDEILYLVLSVESHDRSSHVYVAHSYLHVYVQRCITANDPADKIPEGFKKLREEILKFGGDDEEGLVGLFVVYTERPGPDPPELEERYKQPVHCGMCAETFKYWYKRHWHRNQVHGLDEPPDALPENV